MPPHENSGDELAWRLFVAHRSELLRFVERRVESRAIAEELLQEAFVRALSPEQGPERPEAALGWFYRVLRNAVIDHRRRRAAAKRGLKRIAIAQDAAVEPELEARGAPCHCVGGLARALKPEYRVALERVEIEGTPVSEFAAEVGISSNNARVRVFRARRALKRRLAECCGSCADHGCVDCTCRQTPLSGHPA